MTRSICITQPNFLPWRGYFDLVSSVDVFVSLENVQYTDRDWRNRNRILSKDGPRWLTVPVMKKDFRSMPVGAVQVSDGDWKKKHLTSLRHVYGRAPFFGEVFLELEAAYSRTLPLLADLNIELLSRIFRYLGRRVEIKRQGGALEQVDPSRRLLDICKMHNANVYVTAPSAANYLDTRLFENNGIHVEFFRYPTYPPYASLHGLSVEHMSIIDLLFVEGRAAFGKIFSENFSDD